MVLLETDDSLPADRVSDIPQSLLVHLWFWGAYHILHFKGMPWLSTWPSLTDCLQYLDSFHSEGTVDMNGRSAIFFLGNRCLAFFDLIPMALDWCFFLLLERSFRISIIVFICFLNFGLAFGPRDANGKTSKLEFDPRQVIRALYLGRKVKQLVHRRNSGANTEWLYRLAARN